MIEFQFLLAIFPVIIMKLADFMNLSSLEMSLIDRLITVYMNFSLWRRHLYVYVRHSTPLSWEEYL
jgi:hypothetical protein